MAGVVALALALPTVALAWHIEGRVVCDDNASSTVDGTDTPRNGIGVLITSLTATPGATFTGTTGSGTGFYSVTLPDHDDDYRVELTSGIPGGSNVISPSSGAYGVPPVPAITLVTAAKHVTGVDFLLDGCAIVIASPTPSESPTPAGVTGTPAETATPVGTATPVETATPTENATPTETATPAGATGTPAGTATPTEAATPTETPTEAATPTPTETATPTVTATLTAGASATATPLPSATPTTTLVATATPAVGTSTPTPGSTPGSFLPNHFQCYEVDRSTTAAVKGLPAEDRFGATTIDVGGTGKVKRLCNPASKNGESPDAPADPNHLMGYVISKRSPRLNPYPGQTVVNQFGTTTVALTRPILLMVPSAKSVSAPPAPLGQPGVDHFQCYGVTNAQTRVANLQVTDQFGSLTLDIKRPSRLCVAVDKADEGILEPLAALLCYEVRASSGATPFRGIDGPVYVDNQFGADTLKVTRPTELCVPSVTTNALARRPKGKR